MDIYFRDVDIGGRYNVDRTSVWRWVREGKFPPPVKLSAGCSRWLASEVEHWEQERAKQRKEVMALKYSTVSEGQVKEADHV